MKQPSVMRNISNIKNRIFRFVRDNNVILNPPLLGVIVEINSSCNRKCSFCPNCIHTREAGLMSEELFYKIIGELSDIKFKGILTFSLYNEPLLDERIFKFLEYARAKLPSAFLNLNTNGDLLNLQIWRRLRKAGLTFARVTQYDGKISDNIEHILNELEPEEKKHFCVRIFTLQRACNRAGLVKLDRNTRFPLKKFCIRPFYQLCINYKGKVVLCCNDYLGSVEIADLHGESIAQVWKSEVFRHHRGKLFFKDRAHLKLCKECDERVSRMAGLLKEMKPSSKLFLQAYIRRVFH